MSYFSSFFFYVMSHLQYVFYTYLFCWNFEKIYIHLYICFTKNPLHNVLGRPVSNCRFYTDNISSFLDYHLQPLAQLYKDTNHFLNKLKKIGKLPEGEILCTMDVVGLYPNIPHWEGLASLYKLLETRDNKQILSDTLEKWYMEKVLPLSISFWKLGRTNILSDTLAELVEIVSKNNIFELTN